MPTDNIAIKSVNKNFDYENKENPYSNTYSNGFYSKNKKVKFGINNESYKREIENKPINQTLNNRSGSNYNIINQIGRAHV